MSKLATFVVALGTLVLALVTLSPNSAEAGWRRGWGWGGPGYWAPRYRPYRYYGYGYPYAYYPYWRRGYYGWY
jgi:hypothetical protein